MSNKPHDNVRPHQEISLEYGENVADGATQIKVCEWSIFDL